MKLGVVQGGTYQHGLTLVELMVSITLGMFIVLTTTILFVTSKVTYLAQNDWSSVEDTGRFVLDAVSRSIRQAGYENWESDDWVDGAPLITTPEMSANLSGLDSKSLTGSSIGIESALNTSINGSDILAVRFFGSGKAKNPDGSMIDCAGFAISAPKSMTAADEARGWSIFYVAKDASGEPELRCKYRSDDDGKWAVVAIARGIESFQVLYGLDIDNDDVPNRFLTATQLNELDQGVVRQGDTAPARAADFNRKTHWKKIIELRISLLVRGTVMRNDAVTTQHHLFGESYSKANAAADPGAMIREVDFPIANRNKIRKVFMTTVRLRNHGAANGEDSAQ